MEERHPQRGAPTDDFWISAMTRPSFQAVLFDLDGTLLDTLADIGNAMNHVLAERGLPTHDMEAYQYIQQVRDSGIISETVVQESNEYFDFYYIAIQQGLAEDAIKPHPVELIGEMLYRAIVAIMNLINTQPESSKQEEYIRAGFEIFWNGICRNSDR